MNTEHYSGPSAASFTNGTEARKKPEPKPVALDAEVVSVGQCCRVFCIGRSKLYELLSDGTVPSFKVGKKRLIPLATARLVIGGQGA